MGVYALGSGLQGFLLPRMKIRLWERVILVILAIFLIAPLLWERLVALLGLILLQVWATTKRRKEGAVADTVTGREESR